MIPIRMYMASVMVHSLLRICHTIAGIREMKTPPIGADQERLACPGRFVL